MIQKAKQSFKLLRQRGAWELYRRVWDFLIWKEWLPPDYWLIYQSFKNDLSNRIRYDSPPNPFKTINIRPREIKYEVCKYKVNGKYPIRRVKFGGLGRIKGGDWDIHRSEVKNNNWVQSATQRYKEGKEWKETNYYQEKMNNRESDEVEQKGYDNVERYIKDTLEKYDSLFEDIKNNGYKPGHKGSRRTPGSKQPIEDQLEVLVAIDRDGRICLSSGGVHRFGIAYALDLEIPAHVICRHKQWQETRDDIYNNGLSEEHSERLGNHPDLQDILTRHQYSDKQEN